MFLLQRFCRINENDKMKNYKKTVALVVLAFTFHSCIKHEVIPAPIQKADLSCHFLGTINGSTIELTQNVNGYGLTNTQAKIILPSPTPSSAAYFAEMNSTQSHIAVKIGLGSVNWDAANTTQPSLTIFNTFFNNALTPAYSASASAGFEFTYRDGVGQIWKSDENSLMPQNVVFTNVSQESDSEGDYSKFTCSFNCFVYRTYIDTIIVSTNDTIYATDSLYVTNAVYKGWFKR